MRGVVEVDSNSEQRGILAEMNMYLGDSSARKSLWADSLREYRTASERDAHWKAAIKWYEPSLKVGEQIPGTSQIDPLGYRKVDVERKLEDVRSKVLASRNAGKSRISSLGIRTVAH